MYDTAGDVRRLCEIFRKHEVFIYLSKTDTKQKI